MAGVGSRMSRERHTHRGRGRGREGERGRWRTAKKDCPKDAWVGTKTWHQAASSIVNGTSNGKCRQITKNESRCQTPIFSHVMYFFCSFYSTHLPNSRPPCSSVSSVLKTTDVFHRFRYFACWRAGSGIPPSSRADRSAVHGQKRMWKQPH